MKLVRKIKKHEMLRRWAIGEVHVEYLNATQEAQPQETLKLLQSNDSQLERKGIRRALKMHHLSLVDCLPEDVTWYLARLEINQMEFNQLYTLPVLDLAKISNNTYRVSYAAKVIQQFPALNPRIAAIKNTLGSNPEKVQLSGITVLAKSFDGPYTIIEGNGRLISLYSNLFLEESYAFLDKELEVVIGISEAKFEINYKYLD